jgi:hypothetical protein
LTNGVQTKDDWLIPKAFGTCGNLSLTDGVATKDELSPDLSGG